MLLSSTCPIGIRLMARYVVPYNLVPQMMIDRTEKGDDGAACISAASYFGLVGNEMRVLEVLIGLGAGWGI
jgi:hypothetical protein